MFDSLANALGKAYRAIVGQKVLTEANIDEGIRAVRTAKRLTLEDVAERCVPPTTAQTIGRLETGTRTLSLGWMNRIAAALTPWMPQTHRLRSEVSQPWLLGYRKHPMYNQVWKYLDFDDSKRVQN